jgi:serine protease inhibitor
MTFVVPTEDNTLTSFQNMEKVLLENLSQQTWTDKLLVTSVKYLVQEQRSTMISRMAIPKFTIDSGCVDLAPIISDTGMIDAFSPPVADFTGISSEKPLFINKVFHRVFVQVDESGTTAAAVTCVSGGRGGSRSKPDAKIFTLDRPFMFMLSHKETNTIIFIGKCMKP